MENKTLQNLVNKDNRIAGIDIETGEFYPYVVYLAKGYCFDTAHMFFEKTVKDVQDTLKSVSPCNCADCTGDNKVFWILNFDIMSQKEGK